MKTVWNGLKNVIEIDHLKREKKVLNKKTVQVLSKIIIKGRKTLFYWSNDKWNKNRQWIDLKFIVEQLAKIPSTINVVQWMGTRFKDWIGFNDLIF